MRIELVLDKIRSLYNVGSMFRTADGFAVSKIWLGGYTATPEHPKMGKTSLGAEKAVPWEKMRQTWRIVERLKRDGYYVVALECAPGAVSVREFRPPKDRPIALVVGNEVNGISPVLMCRCDAVVEIPMSGVKSSFNVAVACGVALYALTDVAKKDSPA
jgi:tRNA G18 (ribose-2'-O)-methylase SpoU